MEVYVMRTKILKFNLYCMLFINLSKLIKEMKDFNTDSGLEVFEMV
jgi:hypothetical protein